MRWEELFEDLEAQLDAADAAEQAAEVADRSRRETGVLRLADRWRPAIGHRVQVRMGGSGTVDGRLVSAGADWLLVAEAGGREAVLAASAIMWVAGLGARTAPPAPEHGLAARLTLGYVLRCVVRDRSAVLLTMADGSTLSGTLDRVGGDFVEIAEHAPGEMRRPAAVTGVRTVPLAAVSVVRRS